MTKASSNSKIAFRCQPLRAPHHTYSIRVQSIALAILNNVSIGLGGCVKILEHVLPLIEPSSTVPCRSTLSNWRNKAAHYFSKVKKVDPDQGRWVAIMDMSITIGAMKVLLVLGVNLDTYAYGQALTFEDCHVLKAVLAKSWKADAVKAVVDELRSQGYEFKYVVADQGPNLVRAIKDAKLSQVKDCSHYFANILRKSYAQNSRFVEFEKRATLLKRKGCVADYAHLLPPKHNAHSRFMNIKGFITWAQLMLDLTDHHCQHPLIRPYLKHICWVRKYRKLIHEIAAALDLTHEVMRQLKVHSYSQPLDGQLRQRIDQADTGLSKVVTNLVVNYLDELSSLCDPNDRLICSSDIIESYFSSLKRKSKHNVENEMHRIVLYGQRLSDQQVYKIMTNCRLRELKKAVPKNPALMTVAQKRCLIRKLVA